MTEDELLSVIETDYRTRHMYWIERRLNKRLEKWFRKTDEVKITDLLAARQVNDLHIEVFSFYNKADYEPVTKLTPEAYQNWISTIVTGWAVRKSVSVWSKIKMASRQQKNNAIR